LNLFENMYTTAALPHTAALPESRTLPNTAALLPDSRTLPQGLPHTIARSTAAAHG
jgi:hypothetical protein